MPVILNARTAPLPWRQPVARALPIEREAAIAPSVAFAALGFFHNLCGQLLDVIAAMEADAAAQRQARSAGLRIAVIQRVVAEESGVALPDLVGQRRAPRFVRPRQVAMTLCRDLTGHSLPAIGRAFGRDHTTVMHALRTVDRLRAAGDNEVVALYDAAKARLG